MLLLAVVLVAMQQARNPNTWRWLFAGGEARPREPIDTRLVQRPGAPNRPPDAVRIAKAREAPASAKPLQEDYFPGVRPELLAEVRDNTIWRGAEHQAFFHLLKLLQETPEQKLWAHARRNVSFVQLFRQPEAYRGRLVHLRGRVRRAVWEQAPQNRFHIRRYALLVLQLEDHPTDPTLVYVLQLPPGFPVGREIDEPVELVGFFYKRKAYLAQDTLRTAPLVLAKTVRWKPAPAEAGEEAASPVRTLLLWSGTAAVVALLVVLVLWKMQPPGVRPRVEPGPEEQRRVERQLEQLAQQASPLTDSPADKGDSVP